MLDCHQILHLTDADFIAKGSHNLVYRHPTNSNYLIKILGIVKVLSLIKTADAIKGLEERFSNSWWLGGFKLIRYINRFRLTKANVREFRETVRMRFYQEFLTQPPPFIQKTLGFVDTNLGFGMLVQAERDKQGNYAPTLGQLIKDNKINNDVKANLDIFCQQILDYDLIICDVHVDNIVYAYHETLGDHFVLIDGIGDKNILPVLRMSHYLRNRKKKKIIQKLKSKMS